MFIIGGLLGHYFKKYLRGCPDATVAAPPALPKRCAASARGPGSQQAPSFLMTSRRLKPRGSKYPILELIRHIMGYIRTISGYIG